MGLLRLFLAIVVALGHYRITVMNALGERDSPFIFYFQIWLDAGHAVFLFYVISGFLISYGLENKYRLLPQGLYRFYISRFTRIFPLYWFLSAVALSIAGLSYFSGRDFLDILFGFILVGSDWIVSFADYPNEYYGVYPPYLNQAWSLGAELTFYLLAPLLFRSIKLCLVIFLISSVIRIFLVQKYGLHSTWTYHFFPAALMFFLLGHISRKVHEKLPLGSWSLAFIPLFIVFSYLGFGNPEFDNVYFYLYVFSMMMFLPYLFEKTKNSKILNFMGDLSYPLYLSHFLILVIYSPYAIKGVVGALIYIGICIVFSALLYQLVERPSSYLVNFLFDKSSKHLIK